LGSFRFNIRAEKRTLPPAQSHNIKEKQIDPKHTGQDNTDFFKKKYSSVNFLLKKIFDLLNSLMKKFKDKTNITSGDKSLNFSLRF
jgi:hypothetical protein